ncbi:MAG TPA: hypothetical protein PKD87_10375 [Burkholderiaceae bacterium]|jgi:hypothetical protein|nr:hypothetical protein [Burkholderiaceae bacterium]
MTTRVFSLSELVDVDALRQVTERQPKQRGSAGAFMHRLREGARY